jgi:hypothetical protein
VSSRRTELGRPIFYRSFLHGGALGSALATHRGLVRAEQQTHPKASSLFTERIDRRSHCDGRARRGAAAFALSWC